VRFVVVYQREPHARQMAFEDVPQPTTYEERVALARRTLDELNLDVDVWVDDLGDTSRAAFGDLPHPAIVLDPAGRVRAKLAWCDPEVVDNLVKDVQRDLPADRPAPADTGFLTALADAGLDGHHRYTMLAHLALLHPAHADRRGWLTELAADGPPQQRAWAERLLRPAATNDDTGQR
jgi:hypothetical protein